MKLKVLLTALLLLSAVFVVVAANQLQNEKSILSSETNGIVNQPPNETDTEQLLNETTTASDVIEVEVTQYPFKLTMTLDKTQFTLGEPVGVTLRLEHIGNETLTLFFSDGSDRFIFVVYDETNSIVYAYDRAYTTAHVPTEVEPGEEINATLAWYTKTEGKASPGTHRIFGYFISYFTVDPLNPVTVETPPMTITIVEQK